MTEIATIDGFGRWETSVFSENTAIFHGQESRDSLFGGRQNIFLTIFDIKFVVKYAPNILKIG